MEGERLDRRGSGPGPGRAGALRSRGTAAAAVPHAPQRPLPPARAGPARIPSVAAAGGASSGRAGERRGRGAEEPGAARLRRKSRSDSWPRTARPASAPARPGRDPAGELAGWRLREGLLLLLMKLLGSQTTHLGRPGVAKASHGALGILGRAARAETRAFCLRPAVESKTPGGRAGKRKKARGPAAEGVVSCAAHVRAARGQK